MNELQLPENCELVHSNNTAEGAMIGLLFHGTNSVTVRIRHNESGSTTFYINEIFDWWTTHQDELEAMLARYAEVGNWEQEK